MLSSGRCAPIRIGLAAFIGISAALAIASPGSAADNAPLIPEDKTVKKGNPCVSVAKAQYKHGFKIDKEKHRAYAWISLDKAFLCKGQEQAFTLVSYIAPAATFKLPQYVFDKQTYKITSDKTGFAFVIDLPDCYTQVDFFFGDKVINPLQDGGQFYGDNKVGSTQGIGSRSTPVKGQPQQAWYNGGTNECQVIPAVETTSSCDGSVTLNLRNGKDAGDTPYVITGSDGFRQEIVVARDKPLAQITIPAVNAKNITVTSQGKTIKQYTWTRPENCDPAVITSTSDCSSASVTITNPASNAAAEAIILTSGQDAPQTITVGSGQSAKVNATLGSTVSVTILGKTTIVDLKKPSNCDSNPMLPVTGANSAIIGGVAVALIALGGGFFFLARRRRVSFTA